MASKNISFEQGLSVMTKATERVINLAEGLDDKPISSEEYMHYYTVVYELCIPGPLRAKHYQGFWDLYRKSFDEHINNKVFPSLQGKKDEYLLQEVQRRWSNHKIIVHWLRRFFNYLDRYKITNTPCPSLEQIALLSFYDLVFGAMGSEIKDACLSLINKEREGDEIDQALVKSVMDIYAAIGTNSIEYYVKDFEEAMLRNSVKFYSAKSSIWIESESYNEYMIKANNCLKHERDIVSLYLPIERRSKFFQVVEHELLNVYASELQQKEIFA